MRTPLLVKHERTAATAKVKLGAGRKLSTATLHAITPTRRTASEEKFKQLLGSEIVAAKVHAGTTAAAATKGILLWRISHTFGAMDVVNLFLLRIGENGKGFADLLEC
jgi:hypothetical protein